MLSNTKFGKYVYTVGDNERAAVVCGINVQRVKVLIYVYAALLYGVASILLTARISSGHPATAEGYELDAIASTVIGGTSLSGGRGTILGCVIGALMITVIKNSMDLLNVSSYWQQVVKAVIIVTAVLIDARRSDGK
jgi:inositol transport system permease protein